MQDKMTTESKIQKLSVEQIVTLILGYEPCCPSPKVEIRERDELYESTRKVLANQRIPADHIDVQRLLKNTGLTSRKIVHLKAVPQIKKYLPRVYWKKRGLTRYSIDFEREIERERVDLAFTQRGYVHIDKSTAAIDSDITGNIYPNKTMLRVILERVGFGNNIILHLELRKKDYSIDSYVEKLKNLSHINPIFV